MSSGSTSSTGSGVCVQFGGQYGMHDGSRCSSYEECGYRVNCDAKFVASRAPLCSLPRYMASRHITVRRAARARFIELQESGCV